MCLYPKLIKNRRYTANKKNGGVIPPLPYTKVNGNYSIDKRVTVVPVGCGKCMECLTKKKNEWRIRLSEELKHNDNKCHFVTLTFSNESIKFLKDKYFPTLDGYQLDNEIATKAVRLFLERWRRKFKKSVRHWFITELGHHGTENIHLHGLIWSNHPPDVINERWGYGFVWNSLNHNGYVNSKTINYITKYCTKVDEKHKYYTPKILCSSGIGKGYLSSRGFEYSQYNTYNTRDHYINDQGFKMALPIYYRNHLYNDFERESLWRMKLNKNVRYVNGLKIDISSNEDDYYDALKQAQELNDRLGYGSDKVNWKVKEYERQRRNLNFKKRLDKLKD